MLDMRNFGFQIVVEGTGIVQYESILSCIRFLRISHQIKKLGDVCGDTRDSRWSSNSTHEFLMVCIILLRKQKVGIAMDQEANEGALHFP